jgi:hypothetical protein
MPDTEAGRRLLKLVNDVSRNSSSSAIRSIAGRVQNVLPQVEAEARAAALAEVADHVAQLRESEWRQCIGNCHDETITAVLDIIEEVPRG